MLLNGLSSKFKNMFQVNIRSFWDTQNSSKLILQNSNFRTHYIKNLTSAKVSMPDQVIEATVNDSPLCQWVSNWVT